MIEYFKRFTMDKDEVTVIDFVEGGVFECKYSDEAKSLCNVLNDLDYEKTNLKKENEELKQEINMLKVTISRNEAYIQRIKYGGEWR